MKLYEIQTPVPQSEAGDLYGSARQHEFESELLRIAGGYSKRGRVTGVWRNDETARVFREPMTPYHVALAEPSRLNEIMASAARLWPSEVAWYVAELGEVTIWPATVTADATIIDIRDNSPMTDDELMAALFPDGEQSAREYADKVEAFQDHKALRHLEPDTPYPDRTIGQDYQPASPLGRIAASHQSPVPGATVRPWDGENA